MSFGTRLLEAKKRKGISQEDIAERLVTKGPVIGRYGRDEMKPSMEMALKIAKVFDVPVDYLLGEGKHAAYDKDTHKRLEEIEALDNDTKTVNSM